jgi:hypothetical protein
MRRLVGCLAVVKEVISEVTTGIHQVRLHFINPPAGVSTRWNYDTSMIEPSNERLNNA